MAASYEIVFHGGADGDWATGADLAQGRRRAGKAQRAGANGRFASRTRNHRMAHRGPTLPPRTPINLPFARPLAAVPKFDRRVREGV